MREKIFRVPSVRDLLEREQALPEGKVDAKFILQGFNSGLLRLVQGSYASIVGKVEDLSREDGFVVVTENFRVDMEDSNYGIKSLSDLVKIDSQPVLRAIAGSSQVPAGFTRTFLEQHGKWPRSYIRRAVDDLDPDHPVMGYYWVGGDGHVRATTWLRNTTAAEMQVMKKEGDFQSAIIVDKKTYGRNLRVKVQSRTEEGKVYDYNWQRLPMHRRGDITQYSDWINLSCSSNDPDMIFRGEQHEKRVMPVNLFSAGSIYAFYESMNFVKSSQDRRQFRVNPFCIPVDSAMIDYIDNLRLRTFMLISDPETGNPTLKVLNKSEIDTFIGARTALRKYNNCWNHWGSKNTGYLYGPETQSA